MYANVFISHVFCINIILCAIFSNEIDLHSVNTQRRNLEFIGDDPNKVISCSIEELHTYLINKQVVLNHSENIHKSKSSAESYINANSFQSDQFDLIQTFFGFQ